MKFNDRKLQQCSTAVNKIKLNRGFTTAVIILFSGSFISKLKHQISKHSLQSTDSS